MTRGLGYWAVLRSDAQIGTPVQEHGGDFLRTALMQT